MPQRKRSQLFRGLALALSLTTATACLPSQQDVQTAQAFEDLGTALNELRMGQQDQADRIDSLLLVVVRQDSILRTLANLAGVSLAR